MKPGRPRLLEQTLAVAQRLLLEQWRQRRGLIFWAVFPAAMMLLFGLVYAHNASMRAGLDAAAAGILMGAALFFSCLGGTVAIIAAERERERERRTLRRLLASPLHPAAYFLGVVLAQLLLAAVQVGVLYSIVCQLLQADAGQVDVLPPVRDPGHLQPLRRGLADRAARVLRARRAAHRRYRGAARRRARHADPARRPRCGHAFQTGGQPAGRSGRRQKATADLTSRTTTRTRKSQFKTMKYRPDFPERFGSLEDARPHCQAFFAWYNDQHCHSGIGYMTPHSVHYGLAAGMRAIRQATLDAAFLANPNRFKNKRPKLPAMPTAAWINPPPEEKKPNSETDSPTLN